MASEATFFQMTGITKSYWMGDEWSPVLRGIDLTIQEGEFLSVLGPSGSGKSTLMHILGCLDTPTSGKYVLDGEEVSRLGERELCRVRREKIGFVFQGYQLLSKLTAAENVAFPLMLRGLSESERARIAARALKSVGLAVFSGIGFGNALHANHLIKSLPAVAFPRARRAIPRRGILSNKHLQTNPKSSIMETANSFVLKISQGEVLIHGLS